jgi:hypothetical protein
MTDITGEWNLLTWRRIAADGSVTYPLGEDAAGLLVYTSSGTMIVQMSAALRTPLNTSDPLGGTVEEKAAAYAGFLSYFGTYEIQGAEVTHLIESSSYPNWNGTHAVRPLELHGDELVLTAPPAELDGITVVNVMSWVRRPYPSVSASPPSRAS